MALRVRFPGFVATSLLILSLHSNAPAQDKRQFEYAILVDSTGSMRTQFDTVLTLARSIVLQVHNSGPVSIYRFRSTGTRSASQAVPTVIIDRVQDETLLTRAIDNCYVEGGQTTLLDAAELMNERINQPPAATNKIIVLITDGEDRVSHMTQKEVTARLIANNTHLYAIGLVRELESRNRSKATDLLKSLAKETGGRAIFPKSVDAQSVLTELALPIQ